MKNHSIWIELSLDEHDFFNVCEHIQLQAKVIESPNFPVFPFYVEDLTMFCMVCRNKYELHIIES